MHEQYTHAYIIECIVAIIILNSYLLDQLKISKIKGFFLPSLIPSSMIFLYVDPSF